MIFNKVIFNVLISALYFCYRIQLTATKYHLGPTPLLPQPDKQVVTKQNSFVGTAQYVSPEVLNGKHASYR